MPCHAPSQQRTQASVLWMSVPLTIPWTLSMQVGLHGESVSRLRLMSDTNHIRPHDIALEACVETKTNTRNSFFCLLTWMRHRLSVFPIHRQRSKKSMIENHNQIITILWHASLHYLFPVVQKIRAPEWPCECSLNSFGTGVCCELMQLNKVAWFE